MLCSRVTAEDLGLIETSVLNQKLSSWVILDARPKSEWLSGHIPGAVSFSWEDYTRIDDNGVPYQVWPLEKLAKALGEMGIDENTPIAVYGDADKSWGGEGWNCWLFAWLGHRGPIRLLNGGIQLWRSNNLPLVKGDERRSVAARKYHVRVKTQFDISTGEVEQQKSSLVLIDTRGTIEWLKGHIPGAIHIPWEDFYSGKDRRPLIADALKKLLQDHKVDTSKPIVYYCTGGVRSGYTWLVHQLAGLSTARNYKGGIEAWKRLSSKDRQ